MYGYYDPFRMSGFSYLNGGWAYSPYGGIGGVAPTVVRKDHLKQPADSRYPIPAELKRVLASLTAAAKRGDSRVLEEAAEASRHLVFVNKRDLATTAIEQKALTWDRVPKSGAPAEGSDGRARRLVDPQREAARVLRGIDGPAAAPRRITAPASRESVGGRAPAVPVVPSGRSDAAIRRNEPAAARFRDWNPDLRVARDLGVRILYSSATNEVRCPELGISSRDRELPSRLAPHLTSHGVSYGPVRSVDPSLTSDFSGSGAPPAGDGQAGTSSRSSGASERQDSGGSKGGQIKK
jgi:hypothetical protein